MAQYRIVIVDDQSDVRRMLRAGLETLGVDIEIKEAPSGEEAMLEISDQPVDVLISDVRLPGISGLELKLRALSHSPQMKLILITGMTDDHVRRQVAEAGADAFFFKPIEMPDFLDTVERCLGLVPTVAKPALFGAEALEPTAAVETGLPGLLAGLQRESGARAVLLLDGHGCVARQVGELPAPLDESIPGDELLAAQRAGALVSAFLGRSQPRSFHWMPGRLCDVLLAGSGASASLLLVFEPGQSPASVAGAFDYLDRMAPDWETGLEEDRPAENTPLPGSEPLLPLPAENLPVLDELFSQASGQPVDREDLDAYWDSLAEQNSRAAFKPGALSYEEARRLGLAPGEDAV